MMPRLPLPGITLQSVFNYFIIIRKNLLHHIHKIIKNQTERNNKINNKLYPSRLRGRNALRRNGMMSLKRPASG